MKKLLKISVCIFALLLGLVVTSCDNHKHTYEDKYTYNTTEHWHNANCGHDDVSGKEAHSFSDWKQITAATEDKYGKEERTCSVCGYKETRSIERLDHTHTYDETTYSYDEEGHWHPITCSHKDQYTKEAHTFGDWTVEAENGYNIKGKKTRTCSVCSYVEEQEIPARNYYTDSELCELAKSYFNSVKGTITIDTEYNTTTTHVVLTANGGKAKITEGNNEFYLAINAETLKQYVARNGYYGDVLPVLVFDGRLGTVLNYLASSSYDVSGSIGEAAFSFTYNTDSDSYQITRKDEVITIDEFLADNTKQLDSLKAIFDISQNVKLEDGKLIISSNYQDKGYKSTLTVEKNNPEVNIPEHTHIYEEAWTDANEDGHYHAPICPDGEAKYQLEHHTYGEVIVDTPRTNDEDGLGHKICTKCGHEEQVIITALGHVHNFGEWVLKKPTQTETGTYTRTCTVNENHIDKIDLPSIADENVTSTQTEGKWLLEYVNETCTTAGKKTYTYVGKGSESGEEVTVKFEVVIDALGHDYIYNYTYDEVNGTATKTTTCSRCDHHEEEAVAAFDANESKDEVLVVGKYAYFSGDTLILQNSSALLVTGLPATNRSFIDLDELVLVGNYDKTGNSFELIKLIKVNHPSYTITLQGDSTIDIDLNDKYENASSVTFALTPSQGKAVTKVTIKDSFDEEISYTLNNGSYTFTMCGNVTIEVEETQVLALVTDLSALDFENNRYKVLVAFEVATNQYIILDGSLDSIDVEKNYYKVNDAAYNLKLASNGVIASDNVLNAAFTLDKFPNGSYTLKSSANKYIFDSSSGNELTSDTSVNYVGISISNNYVSITSNTKTLTYYNSNRVRFYGSSTDTRYNTKVKLFYLEEAYTATQKADNVALKETQVIKDTKKLFSSLYASGTTVTVPDYVTVSIKSQTQDVVTVSGHTVTIPTLTPENDITIVLTLAYGNSSDDVSFIIPKIETVNAKEALTLIAGLGTGETTSFYSEKPYYVTGTIKSISSQSATQATLIIKHDDSADLTLFNAKFANGVSKVYVGDEIKVFGYLANYYTSGAYKKELTSHSGIDVNFEAVLNRGDAEVTFETDLATRGITVETVSGNATGHNNDTYSFRVTVSEGVIASVKYGTETLTPTETVSSSNKVYTVTLDNVKQVSIVKSDAQVIPGYKKVTSTSDLSESGQYLLAVKTDDYSEVNGTKIVSGNGTELVLLGSQSVTYVGNSIIDNVSSFNYLTLVQSGEKWNIKIGSDFIGGASSANELRFLPTADNTCDWSITFDTDGKVLITRPHATDTSKTWKIQYNYNKGNQRFTQYTGNLTAIILLKYDVNNEVSGTDLQSAANSIVENANKNKFETSYTSAANITIDSGYVPTVKSGTSASVSGQTITITQPTTSDDTVTITLTAATQYYGKTGVYEVTFTVAKKVDGKTYTHTFVESNFSYTHDADATTTSYSEVMNSVTWNWSVTWKTKESGNQTFEGSKGVKIGTNSLPPSSVVLSTSGFSGKTIKSVKVNVCGGSSVNATINVSVGSSTGTATAITASPADYTFNFNTSGDISITLSQSSSKALYIKSITITYID